MASFLERPRHKPKAEATKSNEFAGRPTHVMPPSLSTRLLRSVSDSQVRHFKGFYLTIGLEAIGQVKGAAHLEFLKDVETAVEADLPTSVADNVPRVNGVGPIKLPGEFDTEPSCWRFQRPSGWFAAYPGMYRR